jgi:hypothetical protein
MENGKYLFQRFAGTRLSRGPAARWQVVRDVLSWFRGTLTGDDTELTGASKHSSMLSLPRALHQPEHF